MQHRYVIQTPTLWQLDYHHNYINPSKLSLTELVPRINETWIRKGIRVKQHLSEPRPGLWYNDWKVPVQVVDAPVSAEVDGNDENAAKLGADAAEAEAKNDEEDMNGGDGAPVKQKRANVMELRAHADRCTSLPDEVVLMGMDGDEGGGDLMIEVRFTRSALYKRGVRC
jgi:UV DNA damage endonuclease